MNPFPDDLKSILLFLKENYAAPLTTIIKKLGLGYDELGGRKLMRFLLNKDLIEPETNENAFGMQQKYCLTNAGDSFLLEVIEAENLDKVLAFLNNSDNDFPIQDILQRCKISFVPRYFRLLEENGLVYSSVSKDHNGQSVYRITGSGQAAYNGAGGRYYYNKVFEELSKRPGNTGKIDAPAQTVFNTSFYGEARATNIGGSNSIQYSENAKEEKESNFWEDHKKEIIGGIITIIVALVAYFLK